MSPDVQWDPGPGYDVLLPYIMLIVIGGFALSILHFLWRTIANVVQPVLTRRALLVSKQEQGSGWCFLTFEFADGSRAEFSVVGSEYASLTEGDVGLLYSQGPWLRRFEREITPAAHG
ncbi:MAG: DUF2500 domain-containing protein [Bacillota bacterium]